MRILQVTPYFPPDRSGGVGVVAAMLHAACNDAGHASTVLTAGTSAAPGVFRIAHTPLRWFLTLFTCGRIAREHDVIHLHGGECLPLLLILRLYPRRPATVVTFHCAYRRLGAASRPIVLDGRHCGPSALGYARIAIAAQLHHALDALAARLADRVIAISETCARDLLGARADAAQIIHNGRPDSSNDACAPLPTPCDLLFIGPAAHHKRPALALMALAAIRRQRPGTRMRMLGTQWKSAPELRTLARELDLLAHLEPLPPAPNAAVRAHLRAATVLLVPSAYEGAYEGLPLVAIEAMAEGCPVVMTPPTQPGAVTDGIDAVLAPPDEPDALADAALRLLADPGLRARIAEAARATHQRALTAAAMTRAYLTVYDSLTTKRPE